MGTPHHCVCLIHGTNFFTQRYQKLLDDITRYRMVRWVVACLLVVFYAVRVYLLQVSIYYSGHYEMYGGIHFYRVGISFPML